MNPSVSQMNIFSLPFQCIGRLQRGHLTSTKGNFSSQFDPKIGMSKRGVELKLWIFTLFVFD